MNSYKRNNQVPPAISKIRKLSRRDRGSAFSASTLAAALAILALYVCAGYASAAVPQQSEFAGFRHRIPRATGTLTINPESVAFGNVAVGTSSSQSTTLTNTGSASLTVTQVSASGTGSVSYTHLDVYKRQHSYLLLVCPLVQ